MSYQVIARKWRPQSFDEVTGQEPITRTLRNAIENERLHHAYVFSGARGVGKTTTARLFAKALNCHKSPTPTATPCRTDDPTACPSCREITDSRSIDVLEIDAASNTGVENVRDAIIGSVGIAPARDRYKIFVIDEVHMLSTPAFNALLKTVEEPPPRVVFIMATTERHKVPETILSRSQQFEFRTIATARILERLRLIAEAEKISIPEEALREIARAGEGSMRDAQSAFDQVISYAGTKIKKEDVELALGVAGADILTRVMNGIDWRAGQEMQGSHFAGRQVAGSGQEGVRDAARYTCSPSRARGRPCGYRLAAVGIRRFIRRAGSCISTPPRSSLPSGGTCARDASSRPASGWSRMSRGPTARSIRRSASRGRPPPRTRPRARAGTAAHRRGVRMARRAEGQVITGSG